MQTIVGQAGKLLAGAVALGVWSGVLGGGSAQAHRRDFPFTYDWRQPTKGQKEIELHTRYRGRNSSLRQQIEFEYGISDRLLIAPYLSFEKAGAGADFKFAAWKLEGRYQLGDYKTGAWLPGLYLEYVGEKDAPDEMEAKLILSRYDDKGGDLSFNYIVERVLQNGAEFENVYSVGYARSLGKRGSAQGFLAKHGVRGGAEWIHNLSSGRINAGPVLGFAPTGNTWIVAGWALPVNSRAGNKSEFRLLAEYEF